MKDKIQKDIDNMYAYKKKMKGLDDDMYDDDDDSPEEKKREEMEDKLELELMKKKLKKLNKNEPS
jgi:hypothetical protein